jgi:hypothetical protein
MGIQIHQSTRNESPHRNKQWVVKLDRNLPRRSIYSLGKVSGWRLCGITYVNVIFPYIGNVIIPTDFHIFQRGRSATNQNIYIIIYIYTHYTHIYIYMHLPSFTMVQSWHRSFGEELWRPENIAITNAFQINKKQSITKKCVTLDCEQSGTITCSHIQPHSALFHSKI